MKLYRVTFQTSLLVEAQDEHEAERIGYKNIREEVSELFSINHLKEEKQLRRSERNSLPWRSHDRYKEPELTVEQVLNKNYEK